MSDGDELSEELENMLGSLSEELNELVREVNTTTHHITDKYFDSSSDELTNGVDTYRNNVSVSDVSCNIATPIVYNTNEHSENISSEPEYSRPPVEVKKRLIISPPGAPASVINLHADLDSASESSDSEASSHHVEMHITPPPALQTYTNLEQSDSKNKSTSIPPTTESPVSNLKEVATCGIEEFLASETVVSDNENKMADPATDETVNSGESSISLLGSWGAWVGGKTTAAAYVGLGLASASIAKATELSKQSLEAIAKNSIASVKDYKPEFSSPGDMLNKIALSQQYDELLLSPGSVELTVTAGITARVPFHVAKNHWVSWSVRVKDYDVGFAVRLRRQGEEGGAVEEDIIPTKTIHVSKINVVQMHYYTFIRNKINVRFYL